MCTIVWIKDNNEFMTYSLYRHCDKILLNKKDFMYRCSLKNYYTRDPETSLPPESSNLSTDTADLWPLLFKNKTVKCQEKPIETKFFFYLNLSHTLHIP